MKTPPRFALFIDVTPRSQKTTIHIVKLDEDCEPTVPIYRSIGVHSYISEATDRVAELNRLHAAAERAAR